MRHAVLVSLLAYPFPLSKAYINQIHVATLFFLFYYDIFLTFFYKRNTMYPYKDKIIILLYIDLLYSTVYCVSLMYSFFFKSHPLYIKRETFLPGVIIRELSAQLSNLPLQNKFIYNFAIALVL